MRKTSFLLLLLGCGLLLAERATDAHHAFSATFDAEKLITLTGAVTKIEWQNPHTWFYMDVKDETGKATNWGMEMGSPNLLIRAGWSRNSMKVGDIVTVEGFRARDDSYTGNAQVVILTNTGQRLFGASAQGAPAR
jgi:hypothetical protein